MRGILYDSFAEMRDGKIIYVFGVLTLLVCLGIIYTSSIEINMGGEELELTDITAEMSEKLIGFVSGFMSFLVFLAVMATAGLVPKMFIKGRADYFISKPISRHKLLLSKLLGIWISYGSVILACSIAAYLAMVVSHGGVGLSVAYLMAFHIVSFLIWLTITVFAGILSGSNAMAIMAAFIMWVLNVVISSARSVQEILGSKLLGNIIDIVYYIMPKNSEFVDIGLRLSQGQFIADWLPFYTTLLFGVLMIALAFSVFNRKSY